jgi:hypothetical protein
MPLDWDPSANAQLEGGALRPAILLRIATDPVIRLASIAVRDVTIPTDAVETEMGAIYQSMGLLTDVPAINQMLNGDAERVEFGLSGVAVTGEIAALASGEADAIRGVAVNLGFFLFDANWQKATPVAWLADYEADSLSIERTGDAQGATRTMKLSCGSVMSGRRKPAISYFTDPDQRRRSADDAFFGFVRGYFAGTTKVWPV